MAKKQKSREEEKNKTKQNLQQSKTQPAAGKNKKKNLQQSKTQPAAGKNGVYTFLLDVAFAFGNM